MGLCGRMIIRPRYYSFLIIHCLLSLNPFASLVPLQRGHFRSVLVQLAIFLFGFFVIDTRLLPFSRGVPTIVGEGFRSSKEMNENDSMARSYNSRRIIRTHNPNQTVLPCPYSFVLTLYSINTKSPFLGISTTEKWL